MTKIYHILVPELVPLENKGEEAIVRGIADVVFPGGNYELHLFDEVDEYRFQDGIHIYPVKWFMSPWLNREFGLGMSSEKIRDSFQSLVRNILHKFVPNWVRIKDKALIRSMHQLNKLQKNMDQPTSHLGLENILKLDYIIAGHDGAMDERVCHIIDEITLILDLPLGVFGIEFSQSFKSSAIVDEQQKILKNSLFFYCRTEASKKVVDKNFPLISAEVCPDPAFGMKPSSAKEVDNYLDKKGLLQLFSKPVIVCTTCETGPIARYCFKDESSPGARINAHREFYASLIKHVSKNYDVNILFLPHALGPGKALDDTIVAADVIKRVGQSDNKILLLNDDIPAKLLKGIIGKSNFLIAERIHSMIGATGVNTPFLCLGSDTDRRINGIINNMVGAGNSIYYMNTPSIGEVKNKFNELWENREVESIRLKDISDEFYIEHQKVAKVIHEAFAIHD